MVKSLQGQKRAKKKSEEKINLTDEEFEAEYEYGYGYNYKKSCDIQTLKPLAVDLRVLQPYRRIYVLNDDLNEIKKRFINFDELLQYFEDGKILAIFEAKRYIDVLVGAELEGEGYLPLLWRVMCV